MLVTSIASPKQRHNALYSIYQLNDRISKLEEYQVENSASRETDEIVRFLDSEP